MAALYVMAYHLSVGVNGPVLLRPLLSHGYLAVDLFFVLSGFILTYHYGPRLRSIGEYARFFYNRLSRVYPLLIVGVCSASMVSSYFGYRYLLTNTLLGVTFLPFLLGVDSPLVVAWSVNAEVLAYLVFPLLLMVFASKRLYAVVGAVCATLVLVSIVERSGVQIGQPVYRSGPLDVYSTASAYPLLRCLAGFSLGMFALAIHNWTRHFDVLAKPMLSVCVLTATLGMLWLTRLDVLIVLFFVPVVIGLARQVMPSMLLLGKGPVFWIGEISYSIYLVHGIVFQYLTVHVRTFVLAKHIQHPFAVAACLLALLVMAICPLTYYGIEKPTRAWLRRRFHRPPSSSNSG